MHALLNENLVDKLFVQELWFGCIGMVRNDEMHIGKETLGGAVNPQWSPHYPHFTTKQQAKVMTYVCIHDHSHPFCLNKC